MADPSPPPQPVVVSNIKDTSATVSFGYNYSETGIVERRVMYYDADPYATTGVYYKTTTNADPSTGTITGLKPGTTYVITAMIRNAGGWSYTASEVTFTTYTSYKVPPAPDAPVLSLITQNSIRTWFTDNGYTIFPILERQIMYGTTSTASTTTLTSPNANPSQLDIKNLVPGTKYYFKSRVRNTPGWSSYSAIVSATLVAGAWVNVGGVWKRAVPYVRTGGVWKVARPWTRIAGVWKEDSS